MTWKRHFQIVPTKKLQGGAAQPSHDGVAASAGKYASWLPEVYSGQPNRVDRYDQYNEMDADTEISTALDVIADFCTQTEEVKDLPFHLDYHEDVTEIEVNLLETALRQWCKLNSFKRNVWRTVRNVLKFGDQFYLRDPETFEWLWIDQSTVKTIVVNEGAGKKPEQYLIEGFNANLQAKVASVGGNQKKQGGGDKKGGLADFSKDPKTTPVDAEHIIHLSLSEGMDGNWPFGNSVLEPLFKTFKQKSLLEDAMIIYRVQRAPERRVFYIDVGTMPTHKAMAFVERVKTEIHQKRIPNRTGGGDSVMDAAYNPMCLDMATRVPLLDGRTLTIAELAEEYRQGRENWVYSCDPVTGKVVPGNITWAGVTRRDAEVIRITLDNGETLVCTPDHKIPVLGRGFVEARHLQPTDSLISFETRRKNIDRNLKNERTYTQVYDHEENRWRYVHRVVAEFFRDRAKHQEFTFLPEHAGAEKDIVHHRDYDRYNNDPRNLQWMNKADHVAWHVAQKQDYWDNLTPDERERIVTKISEGMKAHWASKTDAEREAFSLDRSEMFKRIHAEIRDNEPERYQEWRSKVGRGRAKFLSENPEAKAKLDARLRQQGNRFENQELVFTQAMLSRLVTVVSENDADRLKTLALLPQDETFMRLYREANIPEGSDSHSQCKINPDKISDKCLKKMLHHFGYKNWKDFKKKIPVYNHKITSIEYLTEPMDVGTVTVDGDERWTTYHTFAVEQGIWVANSIVEDYFFAQTSEGRGSKVETLPGGEALGQIDDLLYFDNKLKRGLGVPASYLPSGSEDGSTAYSDGRVGTAYIQEYRFAKYCQRLQSLLDPVFDQEFKEFLKKKGIEISPTMYTLSFNEPQNFSKFRQVEIDTAHINTFGQLVSVPWMSRRFLATRYLGWTEDEVMDNEAQWKEENPGKLKSKIGKTAADEVGGGLRDVGIGGGPDPFAGDLASLPPPEEGDQGPDAGGGDMSGGMAGPPPNPAATAPPMAGPGGAPPA